MLVFLASAVPATCLLLVAVCILCGACLIELQPSVELM